jgi:hypothetical protein
VRISYECQSQQAHHAERHQPAVVKAEIQRSIDSPLTYIS